jgi:tetratricopeptide (TPR) repeat protein
MIPAAAAVIAVLLSESALAGASDVDALLQHGVQLRREGKDREALAEFQRAAAIERTPRAVAQIGMAELALGLWLAADEHIREALTHPNDAWIRKNRAALDQTLALADPHIGTLEIWGTPAGAEVLVNGKRAGTLPLENPIRLVAGSAAVTVRADGYEPVTRTLQVSSQSLARENVELASAVKMPSQPQTPIPRKDALAFNARRAPAAQQPAAGAILATPADRPAGGAEGRPITRRWWFWTSVGVVVVGGAIAAFAIAASHSNPPCPGDATCPSK